MWITITILLIIIPATIYSTTKISNVNVRLYGSNTVSIEKIHITVCFIALFLISAFRGDFSTDYTGYVYLFDKLKQISIIDIFKLDYFFSSVDSVEPGFAVLNIFIQQFTDDYIWIFILSSAIILIPILSGIIKYSKIKWLSLLLYIILSSYFESFNIMRQIMAHSIIFYGVKHLYNKEYVKFLLYIFLGSLFHITSIFVAALCLLLLLNPKRSTLTIFMGVYVFSLLFLDNIINFIDLYIYHGIYNSNYSGMGMQGRVLTNAIVPLSIGLFTIFFRKLIDTNDTKQIIWFNGTLLWVILVVLSLKIFFITRIASFFSLFLIFMIPNVIDNIADAKLRMITILIITCLLLIYFFCFGDILYLYYTI